MDPKPITVSVYVLIDPRDGEIRYVGKTKSPRERFASHLRDREDCYRTRWIGKLQRIDMKPRMQVIQEVPESFWPEAEIYWIAYFRAIGCNLVNGTDGGEGATGGSHTVSSETRQQLSEFTKAQWRRQKESGYVVSQEARDNISASNIGKHPMSADRRLQESLRHRGKTISVEHKRRLSEAHRGRRQSVEQVRKRVEARRLTLLAKKESLCPFST